MYYFNFIIQFIHDARSQKLRTLMTMFGVIWGTVAVVVMLAFGQGLYKSQLKRAHGLGNGIVILWPGKTTKPYQGMGKGRPIRLKEEDMLLLKQQIPELQYISGEYNRQRKVKVMKKEINLRVTGVYPDFQKLRNEFPRKGGRFINAPDIKSRRRVAFIGGEIARELFGSTDIVGKRILIQGIPFTIIGVLVDKEQNSSYNGRDKRRIFIPATTYRTLFGQIYFNDLVFKAKTPAKTAYCIDQIYQVLGKKHKFDPTDREALFIWDVSEMEKFFKIFFTGFQVFLGILGIVTLIVGGIGVSNIMNVVVEERIKEIGIKMALGAKKIYIMSQFLFESVFIVLVGGIIGYLISAFIVYAMSFLPLKEFVGVPVIDTIVVISTISILLLIALFSGLPPARNAANLNPVDALRK